MATSLIAHPTSASPADSRQFRVLFCCWTELDITSGTPVVVGDMLKYFPPGHAEAFVEANVDNKQHRLALEIEHPIRKYRIHTRLWPFKRGHRVRNKLARLGLPILVAQLVGHIRRFQPDCIFAIYAQAHWILATWIASRLTGVPLIYHIHDAFLEASERRRKSWFSRWLERKTLTTTRVLALDDHMAEHYEHKYGIKCTILRHIVRHAPLPAHSTRAAFDPNAAPLPAADGTTAESRELVIGFAGAIYDSNSRQLADLCRLVNEDPDLHLRIWTGSKASDLQPLGISGPRVQIDFEPDVDRWLANLADCDLLYLPLQFSQGENMAAGGMEFSLPTKSFDYLVAGAPILAHCPANYSLSRFFRRFPCGYVLNDPDAGALKNWLDAWRAGRFPQLDDDVRLRTLAMYSPDHNKCVLWQVLAEEVDRAANGAR